MTKVAVGSRIHEGLRERLVFHQKADTMTRVRMSLESGLLSIMPPQSVQISTPLGLASLTIRGESVIQTLLPCRNPLQYSDGSYNYKKLGLENIYISHIYPLDILNFELAP